MKTDRELYASLVYLADTLVSGFDVVDLTDRLVHTCIELLDVSSAGILLSDQRGSLTVLASSDEETHLLELLEQQSSQGPCLDAAATGEPVGPVAIDADADIRWPVFAPAAREQGIITVHAIPMRLRESTIGALNLFCTDTAGLSAEDLDAARALANMATIGILTHRATRHKEQLAEQMQTALTHRVVIEQAKGVIAERAGVPMSAALDMLRSLASEAQRSLAEVATDVVQGRIATT